MGWEDEFRALLGPGAKWAITAEITRIEDHPAWGFAVHVAERPGDTDHVCRPAFLGRGPDRGLRLPYTVGDEILVVMPRLATGDARPVALPFVLASRPAKVAEGWDNDRGYRLEPGLTIADSDSDTSLEQPVVRPFLEGMDAFLASLQEFLDAVRGITTPIASVADASAALVAIKAAAGDFSLSLIDFKLRVSNGRQGATPYVHNTLFLGRGIQPIIEGPVD